MEQQSVISSAAPKPPPPPPNSSCPPTITKSESHKDFSAHPRFVQMGLFYLEKYRAVHAQQSYQKVFASDLLKIAGNTHFKAQDYVTACAFYEQALAVFRYVVISKESWNEEGFSDADLTYIDENGKSDREKKIVKSLKVILYQNICLTYLKLASTSKSNHSNATTTDEASSLIADAVSACSEAIKLDFKGSKAYYLRAKARLHRPIQSKDDYKLSLKDFKKALELDPENPTILAEIVKAQTILPKKDHPTQPSQTATQTQGTTIPPTISSSSQNSQTSSNSNTLTTNATTINTSQQPQQQVSTNPSTPQTSAASITSKKKQQANQPKEQERNTTQNVAKSTQKLSSETANTQNKPGDQSQHHQNYQQLLKSQQEQEESNRKAQEFWNQFSIEKNYAELDYDLSYQIDLNTEIPQELKDLDEYINERSCDIISMYSAQGRMHDAEDLKKQLDKVRQAKVQLEKIARLDFNKPSAKLMQIAEQYDIDLQDSMIKQQFKSIQEQNIRDIRNWLIKLGYKHYKQEQESLQQTEKQTQPQQQLQQQQRQQQQQQHEQQQKLLAYQLQQQQQQQQLLLLQQLQQQQQRQSRNDRNKVIDSSCDVLQQETQTQQSSMLQKPLQQSTLSAANANDNEIRQQHQRQSGANEYLNQENSLRRNGQQQYQNQQQPIDSAIGKAGVHRSESEMHSQTTQPNQPLTESGQTGDQIMTTINSQQIPLPTQFQTSISPTIVNQDESNQPSTASSAEELKENEGILDEIAKKLTQLSQPNVFFENIDDDILDSSQTTTILESNHQQKCSDSHRISGDNQGMSRIDEKSASSTNEYNALQQSQESTNNFSREFPRIEGFKPNYDLETVMNLHKKKQHPTPDQQPLSSIDINKTVLSPASIASTSIKSTELSKKNPCLQGNPLGLTTKASAVIIGVTAALNLLYLGFPEIFD